MRLGDLHRAVALFAAPAPWPLDAQSRLDEAGARVSPVDAICLFLRAIEGLDGDQLSMLDAHQIAIARDVCAFIARHDYHAGRARAEALGARLDALLAAPARQPALALHDAEARRSRAGKTE